MKMQGAYIASVDAKDIYLASLCGKGEYTLKLKTGELNKRRFINTLDYSLDLIELEEIYFKKYRKNRFRFRMDGHFYSVHVINVTFKYAVHDWNRTNKTTYVKLGNDYRALKFKDGIARGGNGEVVGVRINETVSSSAEDLPAYFEFSGDKRCYIVKGGFKTVKSNAVLREMLYENGFMCDGIHYRRMKRSAGSARVGKCLFINDALFRDIMKFSSGRIHPKFGQEIDLAAYESYISLPSSSIIGTLEIRPENILLIEDYESVFTEDVIATRSIDGRLVTREETCEITNSIWDGQSLLDVSMFGKYKKYGMVLLRSLMFKSCCFNCEIQQWFKDNGITDVKQLNGRTRASRVEDIKLITTPSSIKYLKFDSFDNWLDTMYHGFGVVKHDKKTHFFDGRMVQTHYQLINTLQLTKWEVREFLEPSLEFAKLLKSSPAVVRYYIKYPDIETMKPLGTPLKDKNDLIFNLLGINDEFSHTKYYRDFLRDLLAAYYKNLKNGHVYVNGNYSTLLGNPLEMLMQSVGTFDGVSRLGVGNIHSTRFPSGVTLLGSRSPHVTIGNIWLPRNTEDRLIDRYFNLTDEIVCINSIGENVLQRLSGADFDSDTVLLTDNEVLIRAAKRNYERFKTPTSLVSAKKITRYYTPAQQAELDIKTAVNLIGEIVNLSQELNSLLWDKLHYGASYEDIEGLYYDICQLDVMSGIEIDSAKKEFDVNNRRELTALREKWAEELTLTDGDGTMKKRMPHFFAHIARQKGYYNPLRKSYVKYHTSMDYLQTVVNGFRARRGGLKEYSALPLYSILNKDRYFASHVNEKQIGHIYRLVSDYVSEKTRIYSSNTLSDGEKRLICIRNYEDLVYMLSLEKIGFSTMYRLLADLEKPENAKIKQTLFQILMQYKNTGFKAAVSESAGDIEVLEYGGGDIEIFGEGMRVVTVRRP